MCCIGSRIPPHNEILVELQVCHEIAKLLSVQMVAGVCVCACLWGEEEGGQSGTKNKESFYHGYNIKY